MCLVLLGGSVALRLLQEPSHAPHLSGSTFRIALLGGSVALRHAQALCLALPLSVIALLGCLAPLDGGIVKQIRS